MPEALTLGAMLRANAVQRPDQPIFIFLGDDLEPAAEHTYGSLDARAREVAASLQGLEGERALIVYPPGLEFIEALYGCLYAGMIAVPCPPPDPGRQFAGPRMQLIVGDSSPRVVLSPAALQPSIREVIPDAGLAMVATDSPPEGMADPVTTDAGDVAVLQYTSGSTNVARGVMVSHANIFDNCDALAEDLQLQDDSSGLMWLPPYHDMGLIGGMFSPVQVGRAMTLMSPITFLMDPLNWLRAVSRHRANATGGPNFAYDLCVKRSSEADREGLDLSSWTRAYNGAESVRPETMEAFYKAFAPYGFQADSFYPSFGLAEATLMVSVVPKGAGTTTLAVDAAALEAGRYEPAGPDRALRLTGCGAPRAGARVVIVDADSREPCPDGSVGEIWITGPSVALGYWDREAETESVFRARLAGDEDAGPFLRSGDLGFLHEGELFITGRISEVLIVDGRALYPTDVEAAAEASSPALRHNCGAAFTLETGGATRAALVAEVRPDQDDLDAVYAAVRDGVQDRLGIDLAAISLIAPRTIPRTTSGKTRRGECRELFLRGRLSPVGEWLDTGNAPGRSGI
jgi:acyl-CoA synthetase (AMP-forming)/AMP-acid ligase II